MPVRHAPALTAAALALSATFVAAQDVSLTTPGAGDDLTDALRAAATLLQEVEEPRTTQDIVAAAQADYGRLVGALYNAGYFAPVVRIAIDGREAAQLSPFAVPGRIDTVAITVDPGPRFVLGAADIAPLAVETELPDDFRPGGPASTPLLQDTTGAAIDGWRAIGHATATVVSQQITAQNPEAVLDVRIGIDPGPIVTFGSLLPEGFERMRPERIIEIAGLPQGLTYSPETLARVEERLRDTGVFSAIALTETAPNPDGSMDITATLVESPPRRFGFGFEISSDDGAGASAYWLHRNLFGGAERLRIDAEIDGLGTGEVSDEAIEGIDASLVARYSRPATFTPDTTLYFELGAAYLDEPAFTLSSIFGEVGVTHEFTDRISGSLGLGVSLNDIDDQFGDRQITLLTIPASITWDNRDNPLDARRGYFANTDVTPFVSSGGGAGARLFLDGRAFFGFGEERRSRIALRAQAGAVVGADITDIPPDFLFYSGGAGTVRGQEYQSLGATQLGLDSGGRTFLGLSTEFRQDIGETNFGLVAFADAGFVGADDFSGSNGDTHAGAGLGVRYNTPFGPIRVDLATPLTGDGVGEDIFIYIGIGQSF